MTARPPPRVGVAAVVWRDAERRELLLGLGHRPADRETLYALPGGHWESGESLSDAIVREIQEEAAVEVSDLALVSVYDFHDSGKDTSYVTLGFTATWAAGEPRVVEEQNKVFWAWMTPERALRLPLFPPDAVLIGRARSGAIYEASTGLPSI